MTRVVNKDPKGGQGRRQSYPHGRNGSELEEILEQCHDVRIELPVQGPAGPEAAFEPVTA